MSRTKNLVEPGFSLLPRGDVKSQTMEYLNTFFDNNPDETLTVTLTMTRQSVLDYARGKRTSLASLRGQPKRRKTGV